MQGANTSFAGAGVVGWRGTCWLMCCHPKHRNFWYPGQGWHHSGEKTKGTRLNKLVHLLSSWFFRVVLAGSQRSIRREQNQAIFSCSQQPFSCTVSAKWTCLAWQLWPAAAGSLWPSSLSCLGSARFLQFFVFSPKLLKIFFHYLHHNDINAWFFFLLHPPAFCSASPVTRSTFLARL